MGKKARKTRWRRLPIGGSEEDGGISLESSEQKSTEEQRITFNEDEYTKITTPRQDVLFKKGYFGRKRVTNTTDIQEVHSTDSVESESYVNEEPQYVYAAPAGYVDPTGAVYYVNGNTYETYDPYTGTITVVVGPPPQYPPGNHPVLAAIPCQPVPLQPIEWFNPPTPWCYSYSKRKRYSTDSQNCSAQSSESTGPPGSPQESVEECAGPVFPPPQYVYPGYMFGAPMYNMNGVTVQGVIPQNQVPPTDLTASKRRKKRRRRRRGGVTDEGSESSCEEALSCEVNGSQSEASSDANGSHSGASSDAGQGSSCSKTNSDSGINTDPTPNSGSNSPPINECQNHSDISHLDAVYDQHTSLPILGEETNCSSCNDDTTIISEDSLESSTKSVVSLKGDSVTLVAQKSCIHTEEELLFETIGTVENEVTQPITVTKSLQTNLSPETNISAGSSDIESSSTEICKSQNESDIESCVEKSQDLSESEVQGSFVNECLESSAEENDLVIETESTEKLHSTQLQMQNILNPTCESFEVNTDKTTIIGTEQENVTIQINLPKEEKEAENDISNLPKIEIIDVVDCSLDYKILPDEEEPSLSKEENIISININKFEGNNKNLTPELNCSRFPTCHDGGTPVPPPRRKKSLCRAAEKVASKVTDQVISEGTKEAADCLRCKNPLPITEAVTRWLNSQDSSVLSYDVSEDEEDEGIEEGEGSTDQKNVYGNPFLASSLNDSRTRVADDCASFESSAGEWDMWDHTRAICDPTQSVDKYYRLSVEEVGIEEKKPPSVIKTAVHIRHAGPFPCGVCCIIQ